MVSYDPSNWFKALAIHRADTFRRLWPWLIVVGLFTYGVGFIELQRMGLGDESLVKNLPVMHSLLGFAISMLLVFRTNTAYDRWWEGRKLWGQLVNASRNLAVKLDALLPEDKEARAFFAKLIPLFAHELRLHLQHEKTRLELDSEPHPEIPDFDRSKHVPAQIVQLMTERVRRLLKEGAITGEQLLTVDRELAQLLEICGACERIKNTPIPYSYSSFIKKFIVIYVLTLPFGFAFTLGWISVPVVMFIFYVMASLELIAEEIEDPFGNDANDLPMERITTTIKGNIDQVLGPES
ncbi:MAG TPA: bestrophin family protein [Flavobacteriales bacterium]|nr:bestrophin family protein [Flavobacteriales bacterium]